MSDCLSMLVTIPPCQVLLRLKFVTAENSLSNFFSRTNHALFVGSISESRFRLEKRLTSGRNSFRGNLVGQVKHIEGGSEIRFQIEKSVFYVLLFAIPAVLGSFFLIGGISIALSNPPESLIIGIPCSLFTLVPILLAFLIGVWKTKSDDDDLVRSFQQLFQDVEVRDVTLASEDLSAPREDV